MSLRHLVIAIKARPLPFLLTFFVTVFLTYAILYIIDFYPEPIEEDTAAETAGVATTATADEEEIVESVNEVIADPVAVSLAALPTSITIAKLEKTIDVANPTSRAIADLDTALLSGAVRHPDSADFSNPGNIFILGHSSYLPNVLNKNFQAFNGIQHLTWGDMIYLDSDDARYTYRVDKVYEAKASDVVVPHTPGEARLTLATCNSFASKDDRFIVEAVLIDTEAV